MNKISRCESCQYITEVEEYPDYANQSKRKLCHVCANTFISRHLSNRHMDDGDSYLLVSIGFLANTIIDALDIRNNFNKIIEEQSRLDCARDED